MQPFEKHTANVGELEQCGSQLVDRAAEALTNGQLTKQAYQPAVGNWSGMCSPELQAAQQPVQQSAQTTDSALAWAAVATHYWAAQVKAFNQKVEEITSNLHSQGPQYGAEGTDGESPTQDQVDQARTEAINEAKRQWWQAHETYIATGSERAASMLRRGPTKDNVVEAQNAGVLPGPSWNPLDQVGNAAKGFVTPGGPFGPIGLGLWGAGRALNLAGWTSTWMKDVRLATYVSGHWRSTPSGGRIWIEPYTRAKPGQVAARGLWSGVGKWGGRASTGLTAVSGGLAQWEADSGRTDLNTTERVARTGTRAGLSAAGGWAGGAVGAKGGLAAGAAIGTFIAPGPGTAIGGAVGAVVGGLAGGMAGAGLGNWAADHLVDPVGDAADTVVSGVSDFAGDAKDTIGDAVGGVGDALGL